MIPTTKRLLQETPLWGSIHSSSNHYFPQVGGNRVTEAPEVIFDLTQGDEGVMSFLSEETAIQTNAQMTY